MSGAERVDLTIWAARHLMLVDVSLAVVVILALLYRRPHGFIVWWVVTTGVMLPASFLLSRLGSLIYVDPRPFVVGHYQPLLPHTANNGFPAGYATAAAVIVFAVLLIDRRWSIPFLLMALVIDCARVGVGFHHIVDIFGAWAFVAVATAVTYIPGTILGCVLAPRIPSFVTAERFRLGREVPSDALSGGRDARLPA